MNLVPIEEHDDQPQRFFTPDEPWQRDLTLYAEGDWHPAALSATCYGMPENDVVLVECAIMLIAGYGAFVGRAIQHMRDHADDEELIESTDRAIGVMRDRMKAAMADELAHWWPGLDATREAH